MYNVFIVISMPLLALTWRDRDLEGDFPSSYFKLISMILVASAYL